MNDSVFDVVKDLKLRILLGAFVASIVLSISAYYALSTYFSHASAEVISSWYANEEVTIQQGNILSAVTKLQRSLSTSALLKGVRVTNREGHELISFGNTSEIEISEHLNSKIESKSLGLFKIAYGIKAGDLKVVIFTESRILLVFVCVIALYLIFVLFSFAFFVRSFSLKEEKLRAGFELEQALLESRFNDKMVAIARQMAHDIRSPLSAINIISKKIISELPHEGMLLQQVSTRIISIADGLLDLTREPIKTQNHKSSEAVTSQAPACATDLVSNASLEVLNQKLLELSDFNGITLSTYFDPVPLFDVYCEPNELQRIISNIINNSIEAVGDNGFISVSLSECTEGILVEVCDSGIGMSEELIQKAYLGAVSSGKPSGNGLGLSSAIKSIEAWRGKFVINSKIGRGTSISIFLTRAEV